MMDFFSSELGVAIAWICGVAGFLYSILQSLANKNLKIELRNSQNTIQSLHNSLNTQTSNQVDVNTNNVDQAGEKNIYTNTVSGGMKIKM